MSIKLSELKITTEITTPSGIVCTIGFEYDDKITIQKKLITKAKEVDGALLEEEIKLVIEGGLRGWNLVDDNEEPIPATYENVKKLPSSDGSYIKDQLSKLVFPPETSNEDKKK